jgi:hypothetical protein
MEHWLQAEAELIGEGKAQTSAQPAKSEAKPVSDSQSRPAQTSPAGAPAGRSSNATWQAPRQPLNQN